MEENLSILTFKIKLKRNFIRRNKQAEKKRWLAFRRSINKYIKAAKNIANYSIRREFWGKQLTSKDVKHLGKLPSAIANQIIKKYKGNIKCKKISNVNLIVPACSTRPYPSIIYENNQLNIKPLKLKLKWTCPVEFEKINQVELNNEFAFVCVTLKDKEKKKYKKCVGVDLNIKHNLASVGYKKKNECDYLGKGYIYKRVKYKEMRRRFQKQDRLHKVKEMGSKESRVMNDLNQKLSKKIIDLAKHRKANIAFEKLTDIRTNAKVSKSFRYFLNSWQFYRLQQNVSYKSKLQGMETVYIDPAYTSQDCSSCKSRNKANGKKYKCSSCGLEIHRDKNASFNIEMRGRKALKELV